jgi:D-3-phosphoglycerate dehydrogenase
MMAANSATVMYLGPADMLEHLRAHLPLAVKVCMPVSEQEVDEVLSTCDVVLDASMQIRFSAARVARAERLKWYITATTGADHVDASALAARGIPLLTLRGRSDVLCNVTAAAEHSWLLLLACARRLRGAVDHVLDGKWQRTEHPGLMLRGRSLGIIGCGRIGGWMSRYARAFGMRCVGFDPFLLPPHETIELMELEPVLQTADFVSVHVPLTDVTRGLVGAREIGLMKKGVVLINTSRGEIVDQDALLEALRSEQIAAAGLDVLSGEPDIAMHPLVEYARRHHNLIITPHIGGFSPDAVRYVLEFSCRRIQSLLSTGHDV